MQTCVCQLGLRVSLAEQPRQLGEPVADVACERLAPAAAPMVLCLWRRCPAMLCDGRCPACVPLMVGVGVGPSSLLSRGRVSPEARRARSAPEMWGRRLPHPIPVSQDRFDAQARADLRANSLPARQPLCAGGWRIPRPIRGASDLPPDISASYAEQSEPSISGLRRFCVALRGRRWRRAGG